MNPMHNDPDSIEDTRLSALSALVDGEVLSQELDDVLASMDESDFPYEQWSGYQVIGDVLRQSAPAASTRSPRVFLAGIQAELQKQPGMDSPEQGQQQHAASRAPGKRMTAANDPVFRWKMVAGLASLAAVMAVSWTQLQNATEPGAGSTGSQWAQREMPFALASVDSEAARTLATSLPQTPAESVIVNTPQGSVVRDPQLEALMDQHRQHGGMTALQMPTGFLRNATYDVPVR